VLVSIALLKVQLINTVYLAARRTAGYGEERDTNISEVHVIKALKTSAHV
jgi:hypothetical protein